MREGKSDVIKDACDLLGITLEDLAGMERGEKS